MKTKWYRVWKYFKGGMKESYVEATEKRVKEIAIDWAESSDGGHNYGYELHWEIVKKPPKEWIEKEIEKIKREIEYSSARITACHAAILRYNNMI